MKGEFLAGAMHLGSYGLACAFILDLILGEPAGFPHPVVLMGRVIGWFERRFNGPESSGRRRRFMGIVLAAVLPLAVFFLAVSLLSLSFRADEIFGSAVSVFLAYTTLSARGLRDAACRVREALARNDMVGARGALSHIVGRDTAELDESEIVRGTVETLAENSSDGVIAPIFYLVIGGVPLAMAYKAINTLDSMVGYKNNRFLSFGRASARLDDIANFIPARLTGLLIVVSSLIMKMDWQGSLRIMHRDGRNHHSPNAGYPEAAAAGAMNVQLGGENRYAGRVEIRPLIGDDLRELNRSDIGVAVKLMYLSSILMVLLSVIIMSAFFHR